MKRSLEEHAAVLDLGTGTGVIACEYRGEGE